jgi:ribonuclease-3
MNIRSILNFFKRQKDGKQNGQIPEWLDKRLTELESKIQYNFKNRELLIQALKHRSYLRNVNESRLKSNERLEFLGDTILNLVVTEHLFHAFPDKSEGELTKIKSLMVSENILVAKAQPIQLARFILMSEGEARSGGRYRPSIVADAYEAMIGAVYLDAGFEQAKNFIHRFILDDMDDIIADQLNKNFKSALLEFAQSKNWGLPRYVVKNETGPDHQKIFTVDVYVNNQISGSGHGASKKKAEQMAAREALEKLQKQNT